MQYCRTISLDNNNSVKFTSSRESREDNSTIKDSMVIKIAHVQLHVNKNIMYTFQKSMCKTVGENFGQNCVQEQTGGQITVHFIVGGIKR